MKQFAFHVCIVSSLFFGLVGQIQAINVEVRERSILLQEPVEGNVYRISQNDVTIQQKVNGDVIVVSGGRVSISGEITGDVWVIADQVKIMSPVGGDVRFVGREVEVQSQIEGELLGVSAEGITLTAETTVGRGTNITGQDISLNGSYAGSVVARGQAIQTQGQYQKNTTLYGDTVEVGGEYSGVLITRAFIDVKVSQEEVPQINELRYWSPQRVTELEELSTGEVVYDEDLVRSEKRNQMNYWQRLQSRLFSPLTILQVIWAAIVLILLTVAGRDFFQKRAFTLLTKEHLTGTLGFGFGVTLLLPIISIISLASVLAIPIGIIGFLVFTLVATLSYGVSSLLIAFRLNQVWNLSATPMKQWFMSWGVYTLLIVVGVVFPVLGGLIFMLNLALVWGVLVHTVISPAPEDTQEK